MKGWKTYSGRGSNSRPRVCEKRLITNYTTWTIIRCEWMNVRTVEWPNARMVFQIMMIYYHIDHIIMIIIWSQWLYHHQHHHGHIIITSIIIIMSRLAVFRAIWFIYTRTHNAHIHEHTRSSYRLNDNKNNSNDH